MLKEKPQVGDVLIAKDCPGIRTMGDMTAFKEYEVVGNQYDGVSVIDDEGDSRQWSTSYLSRFTLKGDEPVELLPTLKMGDVIIANDSDELHFMGDMTPYNEYLVIRVDGDGDAVIMDDAFDERSIHGPRKEAFSLKGVEPTKPVGLKEVPKMGDVIIAINDDRGMGGIADITKGREYTITGLSSDGKDAWFRDDSGYARIVGVSRLMYFTLKEEQSGTVGHIEINREYDFLTGKTRVVLDVDADGLAAVKALVERSAGGKYKAELVDKIAQCQAEMDQLKSLLAEVE